MAKVFKNAKVLCNSINQFSIEKRDVFVRDGKIVSSLNSEEKVEEIDMSSKILAPSFFDIHSHLGESIFKDISESDWTVSKYLTYTENINSMMSKSERDERWRESALFTVNEMKRMGISGYCAARSAEISLRESINTMAGYPIMNSKKLIDFKQAGLDGFKEYMKNNQGDTVSVGVFLHSVYANDEASFIMARECMREGAEFITVHVSEDYESMCKEQSIYGMSAVKTLSSYELLSDKTILVHCGYISEEDYLTIKKSGASIAICPISNAFLNTKMVDIHKLDEYCIPWCIATDGLGTGRTFSLIRQVAEAKKVFEDISYEAFFRGITVNPANCYRRNHYSGTINEGSEAKFIITDNFTNDASIFLRKLFECNLPYEVLLA